VVQAVPARDDSDLAKALRLLGGSSDDVLRGISLIDSAADRGDPAALERKALLEAVGCERPQNWDRALDCLCEAAEGGCESAQRQMLILARQPKQFDDKRADWAAIRSQVTPDRLIGVPQRRALSDSPRLRVMEGFATAAECAWIIRRAYDRLRPALVVTPSGVQTTDASRTNSGIDFQLADMDLVVEAIRARISAATHLPLRLLEPSQVLHYAPGQEFRLHHDYFDPQNAGHAEQLRLGQRIATFLIYLNDDYVGGETAFPRAGIGFRGKVGEALFLANVTRDGRPDPMSLHSGQPPTSGEKWIFSQWIRDKA
jgi:hypothetical protein